MYRYASIFVVLVLLLSAAPVFGTQSVRPPGTTSVDFANVETVCLEPTLLPEPTGHHQVGTVSYHWVDQQREETLSDDPWDHRQVLAKVFYPGLRTWDGPTAAYIPELDLLRQGFGTDTRELPRQIGADLARHGCVQTSSFEGIPLDQMENSYPVLVFSPGGNMSRHWHTALAQELASHGWVVAVLSHAHSGLDVFPRGGFLMSASHWNAPEGASAEEEARLDAELSEMLSTDASLALDRLAALNEADSGGRFSGRLDLSRVGILGHSRGGSTVGRACATDPRFRACVVFDNIGPQREVAAGLSRPQLAIRSTWSDSRAATLSRYLERNDSVAYDVAVDGAIHMSFSDLPFVEPDRHESALSPARAHVIISDITRAFLRTHLGGSEVEDLAGLADAFPEASLRQFGSYRSESGSREGRDQEPQGEGRSGSEDRFASAHALADSLGTDAYLLMMDGQVVDAYGSLDREYRLHSIRKSLLGTLYGIAVEAGRADTTMTLGQLGIGEDVGLTAEEQSATVRHLLMSRSGVFLPGTHENRAWDDVRPTRGSHPAGSHWFYSNWDFNAAGTAYQIMSGESVFRAFARDIADPVGMQDFSVEDGAWRYGSRSRHPAYVFRMSTRDLARFGQLMLDRGDSQGRRIVPENWVTEITSRHSPATRPGGQPMPGTSYGMMWWIPPAEQHGVRLGTEAFEASGTGGQLLVVSPARSLVFVHRNDTDVAASEYRGISNLEAYRILALLLKARSPSSTRPI